MDRIRLGNICIEEIVREKITNESEAADKMYTWLDSVYLKNV